MRVKKDEKLLCDDLDEGDRSQGGLGRLKMWEM